MNWKELAMSSTAKVLMTEYVTHDVRRFVIEKPRGMKFVPGQGALVALNKRGMRNDPHPFTPTSLGDDLVLEFTIKGYPRRRGLTEKLHRLRAGDTVEIGEVFGAIRYKGPGVFIAAGTGITPFVAILRDQARRGKLGGSSLIFSNKMARDAILQEELMHTLDGRCVFTLTREARPGYARGRINAAMLRKHVKNFRQAFYVCGPEKFVEGMRAALGRMGAAAESVVFEE